MKNQPKFIVRNEDTLVCVRTIWKEHRYNDEFCTDINSADSWTRKMNEDEIKEEIIKLKNTGKKYALLYSKKHG